MNSSLTGWLQLGANAGILIGLILVVVQIQQGDDLTDKDLRSRAWEMGSAAQLAMLGESGSAAWQKAFTEPEELSSVDLMLIYQYLDHTYDRLDYLEANGIVELLGEERFRSVVEWHAHNVFLANSTAIQFWSIKADDGERIPWEEWVSDVQDSSPNPEFMEFVRSFCLTTPNAEVCETRNSSQSAQISGENR